MLAKWANALLIFQSLYILTPAAVDGLEPLTLGWQGECSAFALLLLTK